MWRSCSSSRIERSAVMARRTNPDDSQAATDTIPEVLSPNITDIATHLHLLFSPAFVHLHSGAWIEIAYGRAATGGKINQAQNYSSFDLKDAVEFAIAKNKQGYNLYVGPALRRGACPASGRADDNSVLTSAYAWSEFDGAGDDERIQAVLKEQQLTPAIIV